LCATEFRSGTTARAVIFQFFLTTPFTRLDEFPESYLFQEKALETSGNFLFQQTCGSVEIAPGRWNRISTAVIITQEPLFINGNYDTLSANNQQLLPTRQYSTLLLPCQLRRAAFVSKPVSWALSIIAVRKSATPDATESGRRELDSLLKKVL
jgi:hypothetical protein